MNLRAFLFLFLTFGLSAAISAQEKSDLLTKIENVFQVKEPSWKVERIYPSNTSDPRTKDIVFRSGDNQASVKIAVWNQEKDAKDVFTAEALVFDNTMGNRKVKASLKNLGDENFIWTHRNSSAWPTIKFRKRNILVSVFAPSETVAKRFAQHILDQIVKT